MARSNTQGRKRSKSKSKASKRQTQGRRLGRRGRLKSKGKALKRQTRGRKNDKRKACKRRTYRAESKKKHKAYMEALDNTKVPILRNNIIKRGGGDDDNEELFWLIKKIKKLIETDEFSEIKDLINKDEKISDDKKQEFNNNIKNTNFSEISPFFRRYFMNTFVQTLVDNHKNKDRFMSWFNKTLLKKQELLTFIKRFQTKNFEQESSDNENIQRLIGDINSLTPIEKKDKIYQYINLLTIHDADDVNELISNINVFINDINESNIAKSMGNIWKKKANKNNYTDEYYQCKPLRKYINIDLGIYIYNIQQPSYKNESDWHKCTDQLVNEKIKLYITLNPSRQVEKERKYYKEKCLECHFVEIPVVDGEEFTSEQFIQLWNKLDEYKGQRVLIHCSAGYGRTGIAILSYIWWTKYQNSKYENLKIETDKLNHESVSTYDNLPEIIKNEIFNELRNKYLKASYDEITQDDTLLNSNLKNFVDAIKEKNKEKE